MKNKFLFVLMLIVVFVACSKTSEDQLTNTPPAGGSTGGTGGTGGTTCDTVAMKYSTNVVPILQANCYSCHGNGNTGGSGGISLDGYTNLKKWADNGYLLGVINHAAGYVAMPYGGGKLSDCEINKITAWINQGKLNN